MSFSSRPPNAADQHAPRGDSRRPQLPIRYPPTRRAFAARRDPRRRRSRSHTAAPVRRGRTGQVHDARAVARRTRIANRNAEEILRLLELPYRTMLLLHRDMGFASAKTSQRGVAAQAEAYREIRPPATPKPFRRGAPTSGFGATAPARRSVHTLNGPASLSGGRWSPCSRTIGRPTDLSSCLRPCEPT